MTRTQDLEERLQASIAADKSFRIFFDEQLRDLAQRCVEYEQKIDLMAQKLNDMAVKNYLLEQTLSRAIESNNNIVSMTMSKCQTESGTYQLKNLKGERKSFIYPQFYIHRIDFANKFENPPFVSCFVTGIDMDSGSSETSSSVCFNIKVKNVTCESFELDGLSWNDSHIYSLFVGWTAHSHH